MQGPAPAAGTADTRRSGWHRVIWTPAYHSEANPIEKAWSIAKGYVAKTHSGSRTMKTLREQLLLGFYGDEKGHLGVTAESCAASIAHTEKELVSWMQRSERIKALYPGRAHTMTLHSMTAARRAKYGPVVRPHRRGAVSNAIDDPVDGVDEEDDNSIAIPPPAAAARPAAAAASGLRPAVARK